jgi:hypothetical protein
VGREFGQKQRCTRDWPARLSLRRSEREEFLLAREQRRSKAIVAADLDGYSCAASRRIWYLSLMPRTDPCARLLETVD